MEDLVKMAQQLGAKLLDFLGLSLVFFHQRHSLGVLLSGFLGLF